MPELPEVETSRRYVEEFCLSSTITRVNATEQGGGPRTGQFDDLVIGEGLTAEGLKDTLEGRKIVELRRRGKQMWFVLDRPPHPLFHFGMTGAFTVKGEKRHKFVKFKVDEDWPPRFAKLELQMSNGACLALTDPRRLARVRLRADPETSPPISLLGPDPVTHPLSLETFAAALTKPTAPIKAVLLAQDRVVSGVGNWVADEVCFQARVHPGATCNTLAPEQVAALHTKLLSVCREACEAQADYTVFPEEWLFHHRWGKGKNSDGAPRVSSGHPITFDVVGGRTTAIVAALQKKGLLASSAVARAGGSSSGAAGGKSAPSAAATMTKKKLSGGGNTGKGKGKAKAGSRSDKQSDRQEVGGQQPHERGTAKQEKTVMAKTVAQKKDRAGANGGGARGKNPRATEKIPTTAAEKVKVEPAIAKSDKNKPKAARAAPKKTGPAGKKTKLEEQEHQLLAAKAPAKRGRRGQEEDGKAGAAVKGKRAKTTKEAAKLATAAKAPAAGGVADVTAKRVAGRRSPRLSS